MPHVQGGVKRNLTSTLLHANGIVIRNHLYIAYTPFQTPNSNFSQINLAEASSIYSSKSLTMLGRDERDRLPPIESYYCCMYCHIAHHKRPDIQPQFMKQNRFSLSELWFCWPTKRSGWREAKIPLLLLRSKLIKSTVACVHRLDRSYMGRADGR